MLTQKTVIDRIVVSPTGEVEIELGLVVENDGVEIARAKHGTAFDPGADAEAHLAAVNANLVAIGREALPSKDVSRIANVAAAVHTQEIIDAHKARVASLEAARSR